MFITQNLHAINTQLVKTRKKSVIYPLIHSFNSNNNNYIVCIILLLDVLIC